MNIPLNTTRKHPIKPFRPNLFLLQGRRVLIIRQVFFPYILVTICVFALKTKQNKNKNKNKNNPLLTTAFTASVGFTSSPPLFRATPEAYGSSQARGPIGAIAAI